MSAFYPTITTGRNLILTGYIGPSTPSIGRQIAERVGLPFVNIEAQIAERVGLSMDEVRAYYGETRLKSMEMEMVQEAALRRGTLIRISGRTLNHADHLSRLQSTGPVFCLVMSLGAMLQKMHISLGATYHNPHERALFLGELRREWAIRSAPNIIQIDATALDNSTLIETVVSQWQALAIERA